MYIFVYLCKSWLKLATASTSILTNDDIMTRPARWLDGGVLPCSAVVHHLVSGQVLGAHTTPHTSHHLPRRSPRKVPEAQAELTEHIWRVKVLSGRWRVLFIYRAQVRCTLPVRIGKWSGWDRGRRREQASSAYLTLRKLTEYLVLRLYDELILVMSPGVY